MEEILITIIFPQPSPTFWWLIEFVNVFRVRQSYSIWSYPSLWLFTAFFLTFTMEYPFVHFNHLVAICSSPYFELGISISKFVIIINTSWISCTALIFAQTKFHRLVKTQEIFLGMKLPAHNRRIESKEVNKQFEFILVTFMGSLMIVWGKPSIVYGP